MNEYKIIWEIEVLANSKKEACEKALQIQRDKDSIATVFKVCKKYNNKYSNCDFKEIDLKVDPEKCPKGKNHVWGIDGQHSNEYCKKCFMSKEEIKG